MITEPMEELHKLVKIYEKYAEEREDSNSGKSSAYSFLAGVGIEILNSLAVAGEAAKSLTVSSPLDLTRLDGFPAPLKTVK